MSEDPAILVQLGEVARRMRILAKTEVWQIATADLSPSARNAVAETAREIERTAKSMADDLRPVDDSRNYGLQEPL